MNPIRCSGVRFLNVEVLINYNAHLRSPVAASVNIFSVDVRAAVLHTHYVEFLASHDIKYR